jgi:hypothetical protein
MTSITVLREERIVEWEIQGSKNKNVGTIPDGNNVDRQQFYLFSMPSFESSR